MQTLYQALGCFSCLLIDGGKWILHYAWEEYDIDCYLAASPDLNVSEDGIW